MDTENIHENDRHIKNVTSNYCRLSLATESSPDDVALAVIEALVHYAYCLWFP